MFTIDLLKGKGVPVRRGPEAIVFAAVGSIVPMIVAIVMVSFYTSSKVAMAVQKRQMKSLDVKIQGLSDPVRLQESFEREKIAVNGCLAEVSDNIGEHIQWSPILVALVGHMPDSMVLTRLEVTESSVQKQVPAKDDPKRMIPRSVLVKRLLVTVSGDQEANHGKAIRDFCDRLRYSEVLGPKLESIKPTQESEKINDQNMVSYKINCVFKPQL
jgi:hypothetical protein